MTPFPLPVTGWATLLLAILFLWLTARVILHRRANRIVLGDNGDRAMLKKMRGQANAAEQIPMGLILIAMNELLWGGLWTVALAVLLVVGRVLHGAYFGLTGLPHQMRLSGMMLTVISQLLGIVGLAAGLL